MSPTFSGHNVENVTALEKSKSELLTKLCSFADSKGSSAPEGVDLPGMLKGFYRHVAPEDLLERDAADLYGAVMAQFRLATFTARTDGTGIAGPAIQWSSAATQTWSWDLVTPQTGARR